jgi:phage virion morphogenesis protein
MSTAIKVTIDHATNDRFWRMLRDLSKADKHDILDQIGGVVETQSRERIEVTKTGPDGSAWPGLDPVYEAWKEKVSSGGLLVLFDNLRDSLQYEVVGDEVFIGSNMKYAATHQYGDPKRKIKARPYLGLSEEDGDEIEEVVANYLQDLIK